MLFQSLYLRIAPQRYHYLKFILEGYDSLCLLSTVPGVRGCVVLRYPHERTKLIFSLLGNLASSIRPSIDFSKTKNNQLSMPSRSFFIKTFGCQMNERDSEIMAQLLGEKGYVETGDSDQADLIILNTCSIRAKAEQKVMSMLGVLRKQKQHNPKLKICVAGCVAQQEGQQIIERMPHVDLVIGTQSLYQLTELLDDFGEHPVATRLSKDYQIPPFIPNLRADNHQKSPLTIPFKKFLTIMQGCNNYCSYCVVPFTRGNEISRNVSHILEEAYSLVEAGIKEITLLGQNVNSYGRTNVVSTETIDYSFADLLRAVSTIPGLRRLRFTTSNPKDLSDDLMRCFADIGILCPQFHLPVQSGSNRILSLMNRKYSRELYLEKVAALRSYCPDIALTTDMIVGFPGETDRDFEETMSLLEEVQYHGSFSFKYSDRPGTRSATFEDKVEETVKSERLRIFQSRQDEIGLKHNQGYVGKIFSVMIEKIGEDSIVGRTGTNHLVHIADTVCSYLPGEIVSARILHAGQHSLRGELVGKD
ncbi:MAG: tRNA (N6-isopentenyl adenosine(37)-C2)-methylthiotransferase MiaB [Proteobacteria bacterium]|nr:tRNA (N6-isopentenyl adenosine(37)-C2)-methylthiotransferase MiaB [Pseudomonadota bacterium]MBU1417083.1 tRNA (N6-isopentenyl adenosine(37)-C2)-methylthiotransferase MiaB [Pseudomonadota bacterium]MBU1453779.1 tRNA (N6-isopentenyl adenosine(37)-C2)-methylthiotransferase MiaB [Pseudomonadota bacterium]